MSETGVPAPVEQFIVGHIESVAQLEILLLLRAAGDKLWTAEEVSRALVTQSPDTAATWLGDLVQRGLAREEDGSYRYAPPAELERTLDSLAEAYARYRVSVIGLIFAKPSERITLFSDAFKIRRDR